MLKFLEKPINTVHKMHNERLFTGELNMACMWYVNKQVFQHYAINSLLYLRILREKYVNMYEELILQLCMYAKAIRTLAKGIYLFLS